MNMDEPLSLALGPPSEAYPEPLAVASREGNDSPTLLAQGRVETQITDAAQHLEEPTGTIHRHDSRLTALLRADELPV
jgi:hypothetical protein